VETVAAGAPRADWPATLGRLAGDVQSRSPDEVLRHVNIARFVLEEFRPLTRSLGWQLADLFWAEAGVRPFIENEVPFVVTSNGRLSDDAAAVLFANCSDARADGPIVVLELGAGTGLFARYFLDAFRAVCLQAGADFYDRLVYVVSDRSARTVEQWSEVRLFDDHGSHVVRARCDALRPTEIHPVDDAVLPAVPLRAVICNYSLDVLPAAVVRRGPGGCEELAVRTSLVNDANLLGQYTSRTPAEIRALAASEDPAKRAELIPLVSLLQLEAAFVPANGATPPYSEDALAFAPDASRAVVNHGAVQCIDGCFGLLADDGFLLANDYGPVRPDQIADNALAQRFGRTTALGINFPLLDHLVAGRGYTVLRPDGDDDWPIHARLYSRRELPRTAVAFRARFALEAYRAREEAAENARVHRAAGRNDQALEEYRTALERRPRDWHLLGEVAEFVGLHLRDFASGAELARMAVSVNPWYSSWLWNALGDCLFCLERFDAAHEAYLQAQRIHPRDARTNLNLAYTLFQFGSLPEALTAVAAALADDVAGQYRETLLQKQQQILAAIAARRLAEQERLARSLPAPS
jgi:tetratricopeptide (TPR) repeat protein